MYHCVAPMGFLSLTLKTIMSGLSTPWCGMLVASLMKLLDENILTMP